MYVKKSMVLFERIYMNSSTSQWTRHQALEEETRYRCLILDAFARLYALIFILNMLQYITRVKSTSAEKL